jgi:hypothetical protein
MDAIIMLWKIRSPNSSWPIPGSIAVTCLEDRRLRLLGYEVYRFGGSEFSDTSLNPISIGPQSQAVASEFFDKLLKKHGVI